MDPTSQNYVFYDTETSGLSRRFDQILQFGAILTDSDLNELERFEVRCQLRKHIIPAPGALKVTRISPNAMFDESLPTHYEAMVQIHSTLTRWSPAVFMGYNSLSYDEEMLRQAFYQTLQSPYVTNTGGNGRADVLRLMHATHILAPGVIEPVYGPKGNPSFRLEHLAPINGFAHQDAHDAMADVEATIHLAKCVLEEAPHVWDMMLMTSLKRETLQLLEHQKILILCGPQNGGWSKPVTACGRHPEQDNQQLVFDLSQDPIQYSSMESDKLAKKIRGKNTPIRKVAANKQPILLSLEDAPEHIIPSDISYDELAERAETIKADIEFKDRVSALFFETGTDDVELSSEVEDQIYEGFASRADSALMETFHSSEWEERVGVLRELTDVRMQRLAQRLIYFERPELLSEKVQLAIANKISERLATLDENVKWRTLSSTHAELEKLKLSAKADEDVEFISVYEQWLSAHYSGI
jgi:exodeoxyribonuclease-1